ncbi:unnamed protein product, partial [Timema podura]|nr:unnamed protein product [Timema podura]
MDTKRCLELCTMSIKLTDVNTFLIADKEVCIMLRLDCTTMETEAGKLAVGVEGAKLVTLAPVRSRFTCIKSEELQ